MPTQRATGPAILSGPELEARLEEARRSRARALAGCSPGVPERPWDTEEVTLPELVDEATLAPTMLKAARAAASRPERLAEVRAMMESRGEAPAPRPLRFLSPEQKEVDVHVTEIGREIAPEDPQPLILDKPLLVAPKRRAMRGAGRRAGFWAGIRRIFGGSTVTAIAGVIALSLMACPAVAEPIVLAEAHTGDEMPADPPPAADLTETQIVVKAPDSVAETDLSLLATVVTEAGFNEPDLERSGVTTSANHIRFYHPEDIAAAATLAGITGAEIRDFTEFNPRPEARVVELWLEGESASATPQRTTKKRKTWKPAETVDRVLDKVFGGN